MRPSPSTAPRLGPLGAVVRRARRKRRGVAFVMVLGALTILTVMLAEVQDESSAEFAGALSARDALAAEYAAKSAVNLSRLLIASEPTIRGAIGPMIAIITQSQPAQIPVWNFADRLLGAFNDATGAETFSTFSGIDLSQGKNLGLSGASFEVRIVDEDSKINVNSAARGDSFSQQRLMMQLFSLMNGPQYDPLFEQRDADGNFSDRQQICSAVIDWADPDQDTMLCDPTVTTNQDMPAEDSYYELLKKRYQRKNAAFDSLEEVRRVRGVGDTFWSTFVESDPDRPEDRVLTVWGGAGALNVNSAAPQTLLALAMSLAKEDAPINKDPLEAAKFLSAMTAMASFNFGLPPFASPKAFLKLLQSKGSTDKAEGGKDGQAAAAPGLGGGLDMAAMFRQAFPFAPIELKSEAEALKQITTESKVFSIYAVGLVKAGKRETRVRIHAVVDFRNAPPPTEPGADASGNQAQGTGGTAAQGATPGQGADPNAVLLPDALQRALAPNPAGNVIYYRLD